MYCAMSCVAEMEMGSVDPTDVSAVKCAEERVQKRGVVQFTSNKQGSNN